MYRRLAPDALLARHPALQPRMRAILLDWLIEVCEVYRLHRETFYLAVDFIDRFLSLSPSVPKNRLQLIGVSCLFIGAKIEEIYPPKLQEFAYVTGELQNNCISSNLHKTLKKNVYFIQSLNFQSSRWSLHRGGDLEHGADDLKRSQLGSQPNDPQRLDEDVPPDPPWLQVPQ